MASLRRPLKTGGRVCTREFTSCTPLRMDTSKESVSGTRRHTCCHLRTDRSSQVRYSRAAPDQPLKRLLTDQVRTFQGLKALSSSIPFIANATAGKCREITDFIEFSSPTRFRLS